MKVVFWSPCAGKCSTSSSMAAIATHYSLVAEGKSCLLPATLGNRGIQSAFIRSEGDDSLKQAMGSFGIDSLLMRTQGGYSDLSDAALSIHGKLELFPVSTSTRVKAIEISLAGVYPDLIGALDREYTTCFVDVGSGYSPLVEEAILSADLLVVCVSQSVDVVDSLAQLCDLSAISTLYLITNFDKATKFDRNAICKRCTGMNSKNTMTLPHCSEFADAINSSTLLKWITVNKDAGTKTFLEKIGAAKCDDRTEFFVALDAITKVIQKRGGN